MAGKVLGDGPEPGLGGEQVDLLGELRLQLLLLVVAYVRPFDGVQDPIRNLRVVEIQNLLAPVFIIEGHRGAVLHRPLEVVDRHIPAEGAGRDVVAGQKRRPRKADAGGRGQHLHHVVGKDAVLGPVGFIGHENDVVVRVYGRGIRIVEFLDQGEDEAGIPLQLPDQILAAGGDELGRLGLPQQTAVFEGVADLLVQLVSVGQHHDGGRPDELPPDLLGEKRHGIALAGALGVPEHAQLPVVQLPGGVGPGGLVHAQVLVVPGQYLHRPPVAVVEEDEVFQQVQKILLFADAPQHGLQGHAPRFLLLQPLPFVEELVFAAQGAHLRLHAVGEHEESVVVEQVGDGVQIIPVVVRVGVLHVHRGSLQLYEQQRYPVYEAHDVRPPPVQVPVDLQLLHRQEIIVLRVLKVDHQGRLRIVRPVRLLPGHRDAVPDETILLLVHLHQRRRGQPTLHGPLGLPDLRLGDPGVQPPQRLPKIPDQQDLLIGPPAEGAALAQHLRVIGELHLPAQLLLQQLPRALLHQYVFGIVVAHIAPFSTGCVLSKL